MSQLIRECKILLMLLVGSHARTINIPVKYVKIPLKGKKGG